MTRVTREDLVNLYPTILCLRANGFVVQSIIAVAFESERLSDGSRLEVPVEFVIVYDDRAQ